MRNTLVLVGLATLSIATLYIVLRPLRKRDIQKQEGQAADVVLPFCDVDELFSDTDVNLVRQEPIIPPKEIVVVKEGYKWYESYMINIIVYATLVLLTAIVVALSYGL